MEPESEDWLALPAPSPEDIGPQAKAEDAPPATAGLPAVVALPDDYKARLALVEDCWSRLSTNQKTFLATWRDCRFNARAAARRLGHQQPSGHRNWLHEPDYATVVRVWQAHAAANALDRDRLLARHDDIVETLLEPKTVVTRDGNVVETAGDPNGAARANETLMQAAGILKSGKDSDVNVNVGIALQVGPPTLNIQVLPQAPSKVEKREDVVIDAKFTEVPSDEQLDT